MKAYQINIVLLSILMKQTSCFVWENIVLDTITSMIKPGEGNRTEKFMNVTEMIGRCGLSAEEHEVSTQDGYRLVMARVPRDGAPPVLLMHGLLNSADDWLTAGCGRSLAALLARAGYDVWLGNARGNKYCKRHALLSPADPRFWDFSFHEIGYYDLPAMIDYVLRSTGRARLSYVGQSQGTTAFFILASLRPEYNSKVAVMVSLATIAWLGHARSPVVRAMTPLRDVQYVVTNLLGQYDLFPANPLDVFIFRDACTSTPLALLLCHALLFLLYGFDYGQVDAAQAQVTISHFPAGSSNKQFLHFLQLVEAKAFRQFDHGSAGNLLAYGSDEPPAYPVGNITTPIACFYGDNDWLSDTRDLDIFTKNTPSVCGVHRVNWDRFSHMDFMWAKDVKELVYDRVMTVIKEKGSQ